LHINLFDYRNSLHVGRPSDLGTTPHFSLSKAGNFNTKQTDLMYSLRIHFEQAEMAALYSRLGEVLDARSRKKSKPTILGIADQILKEKKP
jgi:hypothetical protein